MQNVNTMIRRPVSTGTAALTGLLAFAAGVVIAFGVPATLGGLTTSQSQNSSATVSVAAIGGEQVAHNRSEQGLAGAASVGGQQIAHNRAEGIGDR